VETPTPAQYTYFPNALLATLCTSLPSVFIYCTYKCIVAKLITLQISHCKQKLFFLDPHNSPHRKLVGDLKESYILYNVLIFFGKIMMTSLSHKTNSIQFNYKLYNNLVSDSQYVRVLGIVGLQAIFTIIFTAIFHKVSKCWVWFDTLQFLFPLLIAFWFS
jgi:hypothetical protein